MKNLLIGLTVFGSSLVLAHGSIGQQATHAIAEAVDLFSQKQSKETQGKVLSVLATKTAHEKFDVVITLNDKATTFRYACAEDESVDPVEWGCVVKSEE